MKIFLIGFFYWSLVFSSQVAFWKNDPEVQSGKFHFAYKSQVFSYDGVFISSAFEFCSNKMTEHWYKYYPYKASFDTRLKHVITDNDSTRLRTEHLGLVSGYDINQNDIDFAMFKDTFERYCYWPCDLMSVFYNSHPRLKKTLFYIPFLNVLIPYWMEGERVLAVGVDQVTNFFNNPYMNYLMDIPFNVLYSHDDSSVTKESALVLWHQLKKGGRFTNVRLKKVLKENNTFSLIDETPHDVDNRVLKTHEKRQWWLRHLWVSKLGLILVLIPIVMKLAIFFKFYDDPLILGVGALVFEEIIRR